MGVARATAQSLRIGGRIRTITHSNESGFTHLILPVLFCKRFFRQPTHSTQLFSAGK
jgi:hypothetical protein